MTANHPHLTTLLCSALALPGCSEPDAAAAVESERPPLVRLAPVEVREIQREIKTTAYLESEHRVIVYSEVPGRVIEVLVDDGAEVRKGQVVANLDTREAVAGVKALEVQLEDRKVRAKLAALAVDSATHSQESARIERDRLQAEYSRLKAQRPDDVSRKAIEDAKFAVDAAAEALSVAGFDHARTVLDKAAADNAIEEAQARLDEARTKLEDHRIVAPLDGTVVKVQVRGGETVTSATELLEVVDLDNLITYVSRPQIQLPLVREAKELVFTADAYEGKEFTADIDVVSPVIDQETGHFKLRARIRQADVSALRPGMFIRARILTEEKREALMVPKTAVLAEGEQSIVFAVRDGRAFKILLDPGLEEQAWVECRNRGDGGARPDDLVVVAGHEDLQDQAEVEVHEQ